MKEKVSEPAILIVAYICFLFCCHLYVAFRMKTGHATGFQRLPKMNDSIHFDVKSCKVANQNRFCGNDGWIGMIFQQLDLSMSMFNLCKKMFC